MWSSEMASQWIARSGIAVICGTPLVVWGVSGTWGYAGAGDFAAAVSVAVLGALVVSRPDWRRGAHWLAWLGPALVMLAYDGASRREDPREGLGPLGLPLAVLLAVAIARCDARNALPRFERWTARVVGLALLATLLAPPWIGLRSVLGTLEHSRLGFELNWFGPRLGADGHAYWDGDVLAAEWTAILSLALAALAIRTAYTRRFRPTGSVTPSAR